MANLKYIGKNIFNHDLEVKKGNVSGSATSTGSFGRGEVTTLEASSFGSSASTLISGSINWGGKFFNIYKINNRRRKRRYSSS